MNGRGRDSAPGLLAFHLTLASPTDRIAPTFVALYYYLVYDGQDREVLSSVEVFFPASKRTARVEDVQPGRRIEVVEPEGAGGAK